MEITDTPARPGILPARLARVVTCFCCGTAQRDGSGELLMTRVELDQTVLCATCARDSNGQTPAPCTVGACQKETP